MGFIKDLGKSAGFVAGMVIGTPISLVGEVVNSDFIKEIGIGAGRATMRTGELLGNVTEGAVETVYGTVTSDKAMQSGGIEKVVDSGTAYVKGIGNGIARTTENVIETAGAIMDGDTDKAVKVGKELVKTAAIAALAVTVTDVIDGLDIFDDVDNTLADNDEFIENPNVHHVTPHERILADGRRIWVDGDGDTSIDTFEGWNQTNPNYKV